MLHINGTTPASVLSEGVCKFPTSAAWANKYLHPPGPIAAGYAGIPDQFNSPSVHSSFAISNTISRPSVFSAAPSRDFLFLLAPGICLPTYQYKQGGAGGIVDIGCSQTGRAEFDPGYGQANPLVTGAINDIESLRLAYRSTTFYQNTNTLTDKGIVTCAGFRPDISLYTSVTFNSFIDKYREHDGFQEICNALQQRDDYVHVNGRLPTGPRIFGGAAVQVVDLGRIPQNAASVLEINPITSTQWMSRDGAYIPTKFSQPINAYKSTQGQVENSSGNIVDERYYCAFSYYLIESGIKRIQFFSSASDGSINAKNANVDYAWSDMRWYWCHFEAVDVATNVTLKTIMGWEFQPTPGSLLMTQVRPAAIPDVLCMNSIAEISNIGCDAFMAKYNDAKAGATVGKAKYSAANESQKSVVNDLISESHTHNDSALRTMGESRGGGMPQQHVRREKREKNTNSAGSKPAGPNQRSSANSIKSTAVSTVKVGRYKPHVRAAKADLRKATKELAHIKIGKSRRNKLPVVKEVVKEKVA